MALTEEQEKRAKEKQEKVKKPAAKETVTGPFGLRDSVRIKNGGPEVYTIEQIRGADLYQIELGGNFASRQWKKEDELVLVSKAKKPDTSPSFVPDRSIVD